MRAIGSIKAATAAAERFAVLESQIDGIEAERNTTIADANAVADKAAEPLLTERDAIREKLAAWWPTAADALTLGKRKSIELGGCTIGTRAQRVSLAVAGDAKAIALKLAKRPWAKPLVRVKYEIDRPAVLKAIDGPHKRKLVKLGFGKDEPADAFVLERAEQSGTLAGADA